MWVVSETSYLEFTLHGQICLLHQALNGSQQKLGKTIDHASDFLGILILI